MKKKKSVLKSCEVYMNYAAVPEATTFFLIVCNWEERSLLCGAHCHVQEAQCLVRQQFIALVTEIK